MLQTQYGPLPLWGWLLVVVGAVILWKHHQSTSSSGTGILGSILGSKSSDTTAQDGTSATDGTGGVTTNEQWMQQAMQDLIQGGVDPVQADYALRNYLSGDELDPSHMAMVNQAIRDAGPTPEWISDAPPQPVMPTPTAPPAPSKKTGGGHAVNHNPKKTTQTTGHRSTKTRSTHHHHHRGNRPSTGDVRQANQPAQRGTQLA